jgi:hypothetical protein
MQNDGPLTPLMVAAKMGSVHMVDYLVNAGADVNVAANVSKLTKRSDVDNVNTSLCAPLNVHPTASRSVCYFLDDFRRRFLVVILCDVWDACMRRLALAL